MPPSPPRLTARGALLVAAGAVTGGLGRWLLVGALPSTFPVGVAVANVTGSFLLGVLLFGSVTHGWLDADARLFLGVGALGAFTTMSGFAFDTIALVDAGALVAALVNVLVNPVLCLLAVLAGRVVVDAWPRRAGGDVA